MLKVILNLNQLSSLSAFVTSIHVIW